MMYNEYDGDELDHIKEVELMILKDLMLLVLYQLIIIYIIKN